MFIRGLNECSHKDKIGSRCELSDEYCSSMVFKVEPEFHFRKHGEPVQYGDGVIFYLLDSIDDYSLHDAIF